jgi:hypothetical protein
MARASALRASPLLRPSWARRRRAVANTEHGTRDATGVGVVLFYRQSGVVIEQPVEAMRSLAGVRRDHLRIERPELVGDVSVEQDARLVAMARIHVRDRGAGAPGPKYCPSDEDVRPAPQTAVSGSARSASISRARAARWSCLDFLAPVGFLASAKPLSLASAKDASFFGALSQTKTDGLAWGE